MIGKAIVLLIAVVLIANFLGIVDIGSVVNPSPPKLPELGPPILYTEAQTDNNNGYYEVTGTVYNTGQSTAHNAYAQITFSDQYGVNRGSLNVAIGDIAPNDEESFSHEGITDTYARIAVKALCDEIRD